MLGRIAIHLNNDNACARRIDAGVMLAKEHGAELIGVFPIDGGVDNQYGNVIPQEIRKSLRTQHEESREATRAQFLKKIQAAGVQGQWRAPQGSIEDSLALHARYCDLLIMSKSAQDGGSGFIPSLPVSVIMAAGRPVLMLPNAGPIESIGKRILYCWDQRREAARAFADAAPLLQNCQQLVVLEVDRDRNLMSEHDLREDDFSRYCASRGYPAPRHLVKDSGDIGVGHVILNTASDSDSDLIVMGAYGHSRMRQWVMGGASRTLLASMTVPVLLAQ